MKKIIQTNLILFFIFFSNQAFAKIQPPFENISINKIPKTYKKISFEDFDGNIINLKNIKSKIYVLNFWATWCHPCRVEMPSLDKLQELSEVVVIPINIEKKNHKKTEIFFKSLEIKNLSIYFDNENNLVNLFKLRGIPTSIILNKDRNEVARVIGEINFSDKRFINWLKNFYN